MSEETLITAAERLNRFFRIDMQNGGLIVDETLQASQTLENQIKVAEMSLPIDDPLLSAGREAVRNFNGDMNRHGGMVSITTEISFDTLVKAIRAAGGRQ
jgi:hypothetical protein